MTTFGTRRMIAAFAGLTALLALAGGLSACQPPPNTYVALGDSYTSGPGIPNQSSDPYGCLRSDHNYPHLTVSSIRVTKFVDVSCSGAQTKDFYAPQDVTPGPANPPQLDAVTPAAKVITIGIGGNDIGFSNIVKNCGSESPTGPGCKGDYVHDGRDELRERIDAVAPRIDGVLAEVKRRGPEAQVFLVGYPTIIPETDGDTPEPGEGCYPRVPILPSDTPYLRDIAKYLNAMLAGRAASAGVTYVDTAKSSIGHDYCALTDKWVEGVVPTSPAAPVHPNAAGMANTAKDVTAAINGVVVK